MLTGACDRSAFPPRREGSGDFTVKRLRDGAAPSSETEKANSKGGATCQDGPFPSRRSRRRGKRDSQKGKVTSPHKIPFQKVWVKLRSVGEESSGGGSPGGQLATLTFLERSLMLDLRWETRGGGRKMVKGTGGR